jgi:hypothetical protein
MKRYVRLIVYYPCLVVTCWLGMMAVHECGHILAALCSGGRVQHLELPLVGFSRTDVNPNPYPILEIWAGPIFGAMLPFLVAQVFRSLTIKSHLMGVFSGFCLLANGAYLTVGSLQRVGDAGNLVKSGSSLAMMWLVGVIFCVVGSWQWHQLGPRLGCTTQPRVGEVITAATVSLILVGISLSLGSR